MTDERDDGDLVPETILPPQFLSPPTNLSGEARLARAILGQTLDDIVADGGSVPATQREVRSAWAYVLRRDRGVPLPFCAPATSSASTLRSSNRP